MNHVGERSPDPLTLLIHPAQGTGESTLYEDAGNGFAYERGEYARRGVICEVLGDEISVRLGEQEGSFAPEREAVHLELKAVSTRPESVSANGEQADWDYQEEDGKITVPLSERAGETAVKVRF
jgi:alpha-glucosidase